MNHPFVDNRLPALQPFFQLFITIQVYLRRAIIHIVLGTFLSGFKALSEASHEALLTQAWPLFMHRHPTCPSLLFPSLNHLCGQ